MQRVSVVGRFQLADLADLALKVKPFENAPLSSKEMLVDRSLYLLLFDSLLANKSCSR